MAESLTLYYLTAAGELAIEMTPDAIERLPSTRAVREPAEGRPRLAAALYLWAQADISQANDWYWITDVKGRTTMLRTNAIYGVRVDEPLTPNSKPGEPIGFRPRG